MSKSQVDRLGERLRDAELTASDLRALAEYRASFAGAYLHVFETIREKLAVVPTGRPAKSTTAIVDKLRRESIRLSQIQDIAGLRIVTPLVGTQDEIVSAVKSLFAHVVVVDRRIRPSHGYRAVHLIVTEAGVPVEVQVRTALQHLWAEMSEKYADLVQPEIKYGGGPASIRKTLDGLSITIQRQEELQARADAMATGVRPPGLAGDNYEKAADFVQKYAVSLTRKFEEGLDTLLDELRALKKE